MIKRSGGDLPAPPPVFERGRIVNALAELIAERGFRDVSSADVINRAKVPADAFYAVYDDVEACFLDAYDSAIEEAVRLVIDAALETGGSWSDQVRSALAAFLAHVADRPTIARMCLVETLGAGPAAVTRYETTIARFVPLFTRGRELSPHGRRLPPTTEETIVGSLFWLLHDRIINHEVERIESLLSELIQFVLTPYLGREEAVRQAGLAGSPAG